MLLILIPPRDGPCGSRPLRVAADRRLPDSEAASAQGADACRMGIADHRGKQDTGLVSGASPEPHWVLGGGCAGHGAVVDLRRRPDTQASGVGAMARRRSTDTVFMYHDHLKTT